MYVIFLRGGCRLWCPSFASSEVGFAALQGRFLRTYELRAPKPQIAVATKYLARTTARGKSQGQRPKGSGESTERARFWPRARRMTDLFSRRFREGISFPNFRERFILKLPLSEICAVPFALQNRALFEGENRAKRRPEKGRKRSGQQRGQKGKKDAQKQVT